MSAKLRQPPVLMIDRQFLAKTIGTDPQETARAQAQAAGPTTSLSENFWPRLSRELDQFLKTASITTSLPAHNAPPYWSLPFDLSSTVTMAGAAQAYNTWTSALSYTAPPGWYVRVSGYGVNVRDATYTWNNSLIWRILVNGNPVPSLSNWGQQRGTLPSPRDTFLLVRPEQKIDFQVRRDVTWAGGAQTVEHCLVGYQYSPRTQVDGSRSSTVL